MNGFILNGATYSAVFIHSGGLRIGGLQSRNPMGLFPTGWPKQPVRNHSNRYRFGDVYLVALTAMWKSRW